MRFDAVIIGGGHNGLTCAAYLAAAGQIGLHARATRGRRRRGGHRGIPSRIPQLDGELHGQPAAPEGHSRPAAGRAWAAHRRASARELPAAVRSRRRRPRDRRATCRNAGGGRAFFGTRRAGVARVATRCVERASTVLRELLLATPPNARRRHRRLARSMEGREAVSARSTSRAGATSSIFSPRAPATCSIAGSNRRRSRPRWASTSIVGHYASPYAAGSAYTLLHYALGGVNGKRGQLGPCDRRHGRDHAGDGARMRGARRHDPHVGAGCARRRGAAAARPASRSRTARSSKRSASSANVNPKLLFTRLVDAGDLPAEFRARIDGYKCASGTFQDERRAVVASGLRVATGRRCASSQRHRHGAVARATWSRRISTRERIGWSRAPIVEMLIPSLVDDSLAPRGAACREPVLPARASRSAARSGRAGPGTMRARKSPTS